MNMETNEKTVAQVLLSLKEGDVEARKNLAETYPLLVTAKFREMAMIAFSLMGASQMEELLTVRPEKKKYGKRGRPKKVVAQSASPIDFSSLDDDFFSELQKRSEKLPGPRELKTQPVLNEEGQIIHRSQGRPPKPENLRPIVVKKEEEKNPSLVDEIVAPIESKEVEQPKKSESEVKEKKQDKKPALEHTEELQEHIKPLVKKVPTALQYAPEVDESQEDWSKIFGIETQS